MPHLFGSNAQQNPILFALFAFKLRQNPTQSCVPLVFRSALSDYSGILEIKDNVFLTAEPLEIDAVIIKKEPNAVIEKHIADIFETDNIIEYKNPSVFLSVNELEKTFAYVHLYASLNKTQISNLSLTIIVNKEPKTVLEYLKTSYKATVTKDKNGIYGIEHFGFKMQIIISSELSLEENLWLNSLRPNLEIENVKKLLKEGKKFDTISVKPYLSVIYRANKRTIEEMRKMSAKTFDDWLVEIGLDKTAEAKGRKEGIEKGRKEGIEKGRKEGIKKGRKEGIKKGREEDRRDVLNILNNCRDLEEAKKKLMSMG
ncbi:MAG: hypothetical protein Ta2B_02030 [Termitinemataceae bacterium]|nr:MAG: hypothetical protein Ta2B_02030 [Termitinemataceae bacterium]